MPGRLSKDGGARAGKDEDTSGSGMRNRTGAGGYMDQEPGDCRHRNRSDGRDAGTAEEKVF